MAGAYGGLSREAASRATGAITVFQQLGGSFGIAILAVVPQWPIGDQATGAAQRDADRVASAYGHTFWWVLALTAVALVPTLLLPRLRAGRRDEATRYGQNDGSIVPSGVGASA